MVKRLFLGLILGFVIGALVAAALVAGLHMLAFAAAPAYLFAAMTGVLVGLVAGKPIWARGGQIEAGLKAFFGALLGAGGMFAIRQWLKVDVDLSMIQHGMSGMVGDLPAASLPLLAAVIGGFYELDNTDEGEKSEKRGGEKSASGKRVAQNVRVSGADAGELDDDESEAQAVAKKMKR
jgi:hypothetical protein